MIPYFKVIITCYAKSWIWRIPCFTSKRLPTGNQKSGQEIEVSHDILHEELGSGSSLETGNRPLAKKTNIHSDTQDML